MLGQDAPFSASDAAPGTEGERRERAYFSLITELARTEPLRRVLCLGFAGDDNDVRAFLDALERNPSHPRVDIVDASPERLARLRASGGERSIVRWRQGISVAASAFPDALDVAVFFSAHETARGGRSIPAILARLDCERAAAGAEGAIENLLAEDGNASFDMVLIDGSEFTGQAELARLKGAGIIAIGGVAGLRGHAPRQTLLDDPDYVAIADHPETGDGYSVFRRGGTGEPSIHFFTIVLNGEPFIRYHEQALAALPFRWHWHIVEGVAALKHDTAWSVAAGGRVLDSVHDQGRSVDGTSAYLDELAARYPDRVTIHRKPPGEFWDGKREMVNAPLASINEPCLLWQIDADELWTAGQITTVREMFRADPKRTAAFYWCDFFVGPDRVIATRYNYAENPRQEWLRTWRFEPGMTWKAHEPPTLAASDGRDVGRIDPFTHDEMEEAGVVFQHFAYATEAQVAFKETYYGYRGAVEQWRRLRDEASGPVLLRDYLPWVSDETMADSAAAAGVAPIAVEESGAWRFRPPDERANRRAGVARPRILVDGVFYQHLNSGIARVWTSLLREWVKSGFAEHIVLLDRAGTAPRFAGLHVRTIAAHDKEATGPGSLYLERVCRQEDADLFVSTYYTTPTTTPSVFFGHDMIPEMLGFPPDEESWREKHRAIQHASAHIMVSTNSARDLEKLMPWVTPGSTRVALNGVSPIFRPAEPSEINAFRLRHKISGPYVLTVGERMGYRGYKNIFLLFRALGLNDPATADLTVVCVGGGERIEPVLRAVAPTARTMRLALDDEELRLAYAGAEAFVYPSRYEGFGIPVLEAMACGCPAITCRNSSLPEVAGDAALFVGEDDAAGLVAALADARTPERRADLVVRGRARAAGFTFETMARIVAEHLLDTAAKLRDGRLLPPPPFWTDLRTAQCGGGNLSDERAPSWELRRRLEQSERNLHAVRSDMESMKTSPFWRLRTVTLGVLRRLGVRWKR